MGCQFLLYNIRSKSYLMEWCCTKVWYTRLGTEPWKDGEGHYVDSGRGSGIIQITHEVEWRIMKKRGNQDSKLLCWFLLYVDFLCGMNRKYKTHIVVWSNKKIITDDKTVFLFLPEHGTNYSQFTIKIPCGDFTSLKISDIIVIQSWCKSNVLYYI